LSTRTAIDISRATTGLSAALLPAVSREIWADVMRESIIQRLARHVQMPGTGLSVPIITGAPMFSAASGHREKMQGANTARRASNGPG
jgi:hypothetical protein